MSLITDDTPNGTPNGALLRDRIEKRLRILDPILWLAQRTSAISYFSRRALLSVHRKGSQDVVGEADRACEDLIVAGLARLFPNDGFLGEKRGSRNLGAEALWIIDPIDGTHNFLTGILFWCVSVGLIVGGELALALIDHPIASESTQQEKAAELS